MKTINDAEETEMMVHSIDAIESILNANGIFGAANVMSVIQSSIIIVINGFEPELRRKVFDELMHQVERQCVEKKVF